MPWRGRGDAENSSPVAYRLRIVLNARACFVLPRSERAARRGDGSARRHVPSPTSFPPVPARHIALELGHRTKDGLEQPCDDVGEGA